MNMESSSSGPSDEEFTELDQNPLQQYSEHVESVESVQPRGRGRPSLPDQWTQVMSLDGGAEPRVKGYLISTDLLYVKGIRPVPPTRREKQWEPLFFGKAFVEADPDISLEKYTISSNKMKSLGVQATRLRSQIITEVERLQIHQAVEQDQSLQEVKKLSN